MPESSSGEARIAALFELLGGPAVLLPIPAGQKKPSDPGWQQFGDEEMSNPDYIARFNNGGNIGVVLGLPSGGLCSIDIDEDELVEEFLKCNPVLRATLRTRRLWGCNFWVRVTGPYPALKPFHHSRLLNDHRKPRQVGEWRSTGGQTVIEGEAEGRLYEKVVSSHPVTIPFADIVWPEWVSDPPTIDEPTQTQSSGSLDETKLDNLIKHGNGSAHAACPACRENGEDVSGNHLLIKPDGRFGCCKYPADREHRRTIWKLAGTPLLTRSATGTRAEYFGAEFDDRGNPSSPVPLLPPIVDWLDFMAKPIGKPVEIASGLFHAGSKIILGGGSKSYKTWTQVDMGVAVANGLPWLGFEMAKGRVLYINLEIQEYFMQRRLELVAAAKGVEPTSKALSIWNLRGFSASYKSIIPEVIRTIEGEGFSLIIIDPIYKIYGQTNENDAGEVAQLLISIELLSVKTHAAVIFGAHYSKGNQSQKEAIDRVSGSGVLARDPDTLINFTKHEQAEAFTMDVTLRNLKPIAPFVVRWNFPLFERDDSLDPDHLKKSPGPKKQKSDVEVLSAISQTTIDQPITVSTWADLVGLSRPTLSGYLNSFRSRQLISTVGEGPKARQFITTNGLLYLQKQAQ